MAELPRPKSLTERFPALRRLGRSERRIPFVQQLTTTECGLACLMMVLGYHGKPIAREQVRELLSAGRDGTNAGEILEAARYFGLRGRGVKVEIGALSRLPAAAILHWGFNHFVVFAGITADGYDIVDPEMGFRRVSKNEFSQSFTGVALLLSPSEHFHEGEKPKKDGSRRWLIPLLWSSGAWGRILTTSIFVQLFALALPVFTGAVVDRVVPRGDAHLLAVLAIGLVFIVFFNGLTTIVRSHLLLQLRTTIDARMTLDFLEHLMSLPYAFFQRRASGDLMMRLNSTVMIRQILTTGMLSSILDGALLLVYLASLFALRPSMGALVLGVGALQVIVFLATRARRYDINARILSREARAQSYQVEMFAGIETLKAMGAEHRAQERCSNLFVDVLNASIEEGYLAAAADAVLSSLRLAAPLVVLGVGTLEVLNGELRLGQMLAIFALAVGVLTPMSNLVVTAGQLQTLSAYLERIVDVKETPREQSLEQTRPAERLRGRLSLDQVSFRYGPKSPLVVKGVSGTIEPGEMVAIVGRSGSGKSSLASLLLGLYTPTSGRILYDGLDLAELDLHRVRRQLGIVTQRAYLFGGSIRENIALTDPELALEAIIDAAKAAQIHDDIEQMPMKYDTLLLDGGASLSGGQRQRIALARALVRRPAILLLDEATSALDAISERKVQEELSRMRCTRILIAHRLSTVVGADRILVMEDGHLVEQGTHAELRTRGGVYAQLLQGQLDSPAG